MVLKKGVLIIDLPINCEDCNYCNNDCTCMLTNRDIEFYDNKRDERCPFIEFDKYLLKTHAKDFIIYDKNYLLKNIDKEYNLWNVIK